MLLFIRNLSLLFITLAITLSNYTAAQTIEPSLKSIKPLLVDKNVTDKTAIMFYSLKKSSKKGIMVGHMDAFISHHDASLKNDMTDMKLTCGKHPLLIGSDFMFITDKGNTPGSWQSKEEVKIIEQVKTSYKKGLVNIFCWHFRNPYDEKWFSLGDSKEDKEIAKKSLPSILPGGEKHNWYKSKLKKVASIFNELKDEKGELIPVFFRPYHEFDGSWFWWGKSFCTPDQFKANWKFTVQYLRDSLKVHNVLYAFSPDCGFSKTEEYLERYPGDDYVDLVGMDNYWHFENNELTKAADRLKIISDYAISHNKLAALTELGYRKKENDKPENLFTKIYLSAITSKPLELAFMMFWNNNKNDNFIPTPGLKTTNDFKKFIDDEYTLVEGEVGDIYKLPNSNVVFDKNHKESKWFFKNGNVLVNNIDKTDIKVEMFSLNGTLLGSKKIVANSSCNVNCKISGVSLFTITSNNGKAVLPVMNTK